MPPNISAFVAPCITARSESGTTKNGKLRPHKSEIPEPQVQQEPVPGPKQSIKGKRKIQYFNIGLKQTTKNLLIENKLIFLKLYGKFLFLSNAKTI